MSRIQNLKVINRKVQIQALIAVLCAGLMFSSCGNIDIVKRKYRPGFHVDITKKKDKRKAAETAKVNIERTVETATTVPSKTAKLQPEVVDDQLSASSDDALATKYTEKQAKKARLKKEFSSPEFKGLSFERKMKKIQQELFKPKPVRSEWMKWVAFGTGIGSLVFGFFGFLFALLTAAFWTPFVWPAAVLAIILGAAAITFYILFKKGNGTDSLARLGFIFGIVGAGLGVLAIIFGAIFYSIFILG